MLASLALAAQAEVQEAQQLDPYPVHASPGQTLRQALNAATPITSEGQRFHGYTHWNVRWNFGWQPDAQGRCRITHVRVKLSSRIQMPDLVTATPTQSATFARYHAALLQHEQGHVDFGRQTAQAIDRGIAALPAAPDCPTLERQANALARSLLNEQTQRERAYDQRTRHGASQGASLD